MKRNGRDCYPHTCLNKIQVSIKFYISHQKIKINKFHGKKLRFEHLNYVSPVCVSFQSRDTTGLS